MAKNRGGMCLPFTLRSKANSREGLSFLYKVFGLNNLGLTIEFRLRVGIGYREVRDDDRKAVS